MKINQAINDDMHAAADAEYSEIAKGQRQFFASLAERIEAGKTLSSYERAIAAAALRHVGKSIREKRPRPAGKPAKLPDFEFVMEFLRLTRYLSVSKNEAYQQLAEQYGVSETAVKKHLGLGNSLEAIIRKEEINNTLRAFEIDPI